MAEHCLSAAWARPVWHSAPPADRPISWLRPWRRPGKASRRGSDEQFLPRPVHLDRRRTNLDVRRTLLRWREPGDLGNVGGLQRRRGTVFRGTALSRLLLFPRRRDVDSSSESAGRTGTVERDGVPSKLRDDVSNLSG